MCSIEISRLLFVPKIDMLSSVQSIIMKIGLMFRSEDYKSSVWNSVVFVYKELFLKLQSLPLK